MPNFGWVTTTNQDCASLYLNGNVIADIEYYAAAYWRIVYYDRSEGRVKLQFAFEDSELSQAAIRLKVEAKIKEERSCLKQMPSDATRTSVSPSATSARMKARSG